MAHPKRIRKYARASETRFTSGHRFEHWYVNNQVYFITARCRGRYPAFASARAKTVFWDRFSHYTAIAGFEPWITSLLDNHYHTIGYISDASTLKTMMQRLHGSIAKLVNDILESEGFDRHPNFFRDQRGHEYFDGCLRDETQLRRTWRYLERQSERHGVCDDWRRYEHTRITMPLDKALARAHQLGAFMPDIPYKRYER